MSWFKVYREDTPNKNDRLNALTIDLTTDEDLSGPPLEAALSAVRQIAKDYPGPYTVFLSGGVDSQAMALAWKMSGVPFRAVHYTYGTNSVDSQFAIDFCVKNKIDLDVLCFDAKSFIQSSELQTLAKKYDTTSPHILTYIKLLEQHSETCILAGNFIDGWSAGINWTILALDRYAQENKNVVPFFFLYTPQLSYAFLNSYLKHLDSRVGEEYAAKIAALQDAGFDVLAQDNKLTGFEEIKESFDAVTVDARTRLKWANRPSKRPFDLLFRYSLFDVIGKYSEVTRLKINENFINMKDA